MDRRRTVQTFLAFGAFSALRPALAQQPSRRWRIGVLLGTERGAAKVQLAAFLEGLRDSGWEDGRNIEIVARIGEGNIRLIQTQIQEILAVRPDVIAVSTATALRETKQTAGDIPIVFWAASDPVGNRFVNSLTRPGGSVTGFSLYDYEMGGRWLQLLREAVPRLRRVLTVMNAKNPNWPGWVRAIDKAASAMNLSVTHPSVTEPAHIEPAISDFAREQNGGLLVLPDPFVSVHRELVLSAATRHRLPSIFGLIEVADSGGLISYVVDQVDLARRAAGYVSRVLNGEKPANLPVQAPTRFLLVVNLKTAKVLGIRIPQSILVQAERVIE